MYLLFSFTMGGTEKLVVNICNQMKQNGEDVHLFIVNDLLDESLLNKLDKRISIKLLRRKVGSKDKISPIIRVSKYVRENMIDIVHCNSFNAPELLILSKFINPKCKIVSTIHGVGQFNGISRLKINLKNMICDRFIGISNAVKNDIVQAGINESKVVRIYNGIDVSKYKFVKVKPFDESHVVICCIARIMPSIKGQDVLLKAAKQLKGKFPDIRVLFAGGVAESQKKDYEELIKYVESNNLSENVNFLGVIDDVPSFLNTVDICIVPSRSEGFGLALVEALSMGIPCIASDIDGPKEILENENVGMLFHNGDAVDLSKKIEMTIFNYRDIKELTLKNRETIKEKYSIQYMCEKITNTYIDCIES